MFMFFAVSYVGEKSNLIAQLLPSPLYLFILWWIQYFC
jgi:hypothetical protein